MKKTTQCTTQDESRRGAFPTSRRRLLIFSQVFVPDPAAVGQCFGDLAVAMARRGHSVRVYTSARGYEDPSVHYPARENLEGVDVRRLPFASFGKRSILTRLIGTAAFMAQVLFIGLFSRDVAGILFSTSPPMIGLVVTFIAKLRGFRTAYWAMDLNPDQIIAMGKVKAEDRSARLMERVNRFILHNTSLVIALDRFMADRLEKRMPLRHKMVVLPPWPHEEHVTGGEPQSEAEAQREGEAPAEPSCEEVHVGSASADAVSDAAPTASADADPTAGLRARTARRASSSGAANPFRLRHHLGDRRVIMYSGNHSPANPLTTLLEAALRFRDRDDVRFLFVGGGQGKREVESFIHERGLRNAVSLPYQPMADLRYSLAAADVHIVSLGDSMVGIIHPCKAYGAMAAARPILFLGPRPSHISDLLDAQQIGWQVSHGDVDGAGRAIERILSTPREALRAMGRRAREMLSATLSQSMLCGRMCDEIESRLRLDRSAGRIGA